jgi:predicted porin
LFNFLVIYFVVIGETTMKKLLIGTAAVALGLAFAGPAAHAATAQDGVKLGVGGFFKGYVASISQDEATGKSIRNIDILRNTEIHFTGETTLDNGLTVGFHTEELADPGDSFKVQESYAYFSGSWGRVNFGAEDGAAYLLQVSAPSADANVDGIRQYIQPVNYTNGPADYVKLKNTRMDYAQDETGYYDKLTYLSPVFNGFQVGASYTPDVLDFNGNTSRSLSGSVLDKVAGHYGSAWEGSARYEGQFDQFGLTLGGAYTNVNLEKAAANKDDDKAWNVGGNVSFSAFNIGADYKHDNNGVSTSNGDTKMWVVGGDYTTGPYKLGVSYMNRKDEKNSGFAVAAHDMDTDRYTGGVVYTYGPGMTFRGSVQYIEHDANDPGVSKMNATSVLLGTQINF